MNKHIKNWYIAVVVTELVTVVFEAFIFFGNLLSGSSIYNALDYMCVFSMMFATGVWLPLLAGFIGVCIETKFKSEIAAPILRGIPLIFSILGIFHVHGLQDLPRGLFYMLCGFISFFGVVFAIVHVYEIKKKEYAEFLAMPSELFEGKSVLLLIPLAALTAACLIPAANGYMYNLL